MHVFAIGDIHGCHEIYKRVVHHVDRLAVDALILAGDLFGGASGNDSIEEGQRGDAGRILDALSPLRCEVLYILGNDDLVPLDPVPARWRHLHARRHEVGAWNFVGYQYSPLFMGGILEKPEAEIAADIEALAQHMDRQTILVTHCPADGILDGGETKDEVGEVLEQAGLRLRPGSAAVGRIASERHVRAHVHGHVHRAFGRHGSHFNVASGPRQLRAMVIDLETLQHRVIIEDPIT